MKRPKKTSTWMRGGAAFLGSALALSAIAQTGYRIGENGDSANKGPVRMARVSYQTGNVNWRAASDQKWSTAAMNLPMRQGAEVWVPDGSRGEIQFDDGSVLRLGGGAVATLSTLYSDDQGEFTEIKMTNGLATLHLTTERSVYQVDTPTAAVKAYGPAVIRVGDTSGLEVGVTKGQCLVQGSPGKFTVNAGQYLDMKCPTCRCSVAKIPKGDQWDAFNDHRDQAIYRPHPHLPATIGLEANNMDDYGSWHHDPKYGDVWSPREDRGWRPYHEGHWNWVSPFGWTWVASEPWGWAPYHYGTWVDESYGWAWCPGPAYQPWCPAVVDFSDYNGNVAWAPLAPYEVRYPASYATVGIGLGNFALSFSIGSAGCYYPTDNYCSPYAWDNQYANVNVGLFFGSGVSSYYRTDPWLGRAYGRNRFFPANARYGGGSYVSSNTFASGGGYRGLARNQTAFFTKGHGFVNPASRVGPLSGPFNVRPTATSWTPSRRFISRAPSAAIASRAVYRAPVSSFVARSSGFRGKSFDPTTVRAASLGRVATPAVGRAAFSRPQRMANPTTGRPALGRPATGRPAMNRATPTRTPATGYNRFNNVSHSPFTNGKAAVRTNQPGRTTTRPTAVNRPGHVNVNPRVAAGRQPAGSFNRVNHQAAPRSAVRTAQPARQVRPSSPARSRSAARPTTARPVARPSRPTRQVRPSNPVRSRPAARPTVRHAAPRSGGNRGSSRPMSRPRSNGFGGGNRGGGSPRQAPRSTPRSFGGNRGGSPRPAPRMNPGGSGGHRGGGAPRSAPRPASRPSGGDHRKHGG